MRTELLPGDAVWFRDVWDVPVRMIVDFVVPLTGLVVGLSSRNSIVRKPRSEVYRIENNSKHFLLVDHSGLPRIAANSVADLMVKWSAAAL